MSVIDRGYGIARSRILKNPKFFCCCGNCRFFGNEMDFDSEEYCHNPNVTEYDMTYEDNRVYCSQWEGFNADDKKEVPKARKTGSIRSKEKKTSRR